MFFSKAGVMLAVCALAASILSSHSAIQTDRRKVAEGEYLMTLEEQYGANKEVTEWRESWVLWKVEGDGFEVESAWRVQTPGEETVRFETWMALSSRLHTLRLRGLAGKRLMPINCELAQDEIRCETNGERPRLALTGSYDLYNSSPWIVASIAGRSSLDRAKAAPVKLVIMDRGGPESLLGFGAFEGQVFYLGEEALTIAGREFDAGKFELKAEPFSNLLFWTSKEGIVLALQDEKKRARLELVRYNQHGGFHRN